MEVNIEKTQYLLEQFLLNDVKCPSLFSFYNIKIEGFF